MKKYLFLFTISPVQSFIAQARKTQDLFAGSALLSELCRLALQKVQARYHGQVIFPSSEMGSLPNRFLAVLEGEDDETLREIGGYLEDDFRADLDLIAQVILNSLHLPEPEGFRQQVKDYFQVFWAFHPLEGNYEQAYRTVERLVGQAKSVRPFKQPLPESGRKCSLTGEHEALFYRETGKPFAHLSKKALKLPSDVPVRYMAEGEALGAVGFIKRCAELYFRNEGTRAVRKDYSFPSTCRIALSDALSQLADKDSSFSDKVKSKFDEELIFDFKNKGFNPEKEMPLPSSREIASDWVKAWEIYQGLERYKIKYSSYYAILVFDGDSMGEWLSGQRLAEEISLEKFHAELSRALAQFASRAGKEIVLTPKGATVYAGGDDFLGLVNLTYLMQVLKTLRSEFDMLDFSAYSADKLTFSAGVAIAHYKTPLSVALGWARNMEKEAKAPRIGKDALGLAIVKHSGEVVKTVGRWHSGEDTWITDDIEFILDNLRGNFSNTFITTFGREFQILAKEQDRQQKVGEHLDEMVKSELKRLLLRSCLGEEEDKKSKSEDLWNLLYRDFIHFKRLDGFLDFLEVIRFLSREVVSHAAEA